MARASFDSGRRAAFAQYAALVLLQAACASREEEPRPDEGGVRFEGVTEVSESELRELIEDDLKRYRERPRPTVLTDAIFRMERLYRLEGHAEVRIAYEERPEGRVLFRVWEGPRYVLGRIHFVGNRAVSEKEFEEARPSGLLGGDVPYSRRIAALLKDAVSAAYGELGYIDVRVDDPVERADREERKMNLTFHIAEGKRYVLEAYEGLPEEKELRAALEGRLGGPFTPWTPGEVETAVVDYFRDHGHPFARAAVAPRVDRGAGRVALEVKAEPGPEARLGDLFVTGNTWTRKGFIRRRSALEEGQEYRASDLREAEARLRSTQLFRTVRVTPGVLDEATGTLAVDVVLEERDPAEVSIRAGYGTLDGPRVGADFSYLNLFGGAEYLRLGGTVSNFGWRPDVEVAFPYFLGTEMRPGATAWFENREFPSYEVNAVGAVVSLFVPVLEKIAFTGGVRYTVIETEEVDPGVPPGDLLDFDYAAVFISPTLDLRDNRLYPSQGFVVNGMLEYAPESISPDIQFVQASGRAALYLPVPREWVAALSLQGGVILPQDETGEIPISLRYFAGGTNTVRGFKFGTIGPQAAGDPTGGEVYLAAQAELRFPIWADLHGAVFTDRGGVWFTHDEIDLDETRYSVGLGLRYYTVAGAFVLDVGWNPSKEEDERAVVAHLAIGFPF